MATTMDTLSHKAQRAAFGVALDMARRRLGGLTQPEAEAFALG